MILRTTVFDVEEWVFDSGSLDGGSEAKTEELVRVMNEVRKRGRVRVAWVKAHMGIPGKEKADERTRFYTRVVSPEVLTEGG